MAPILLLWEVLLLWCGNCWAGPCARHWFSPASAFSLLQWLHGIWCRILMEIPNIGLFTCTGQELMIFWVICFQRIVFMKQRCRRLAKLTDKEDGDPSAAAGYGKGRWLYVLSCWPKCAIALCPARLVFLEIAYKLGSLAQAGLILRGVCKIENSSSQMVYWKPWGC